MKPITTLYKGFRMKKRYIGLCLTLLTCNLALSDLKDFSPGEDESSSVNQAPIVIGSQKKAKVYETFKQASDALSKETEKKLEKVIAQLLTKYQATVKQNNATTAQSQQEMEEAFAHIFAENKEALGEQRQMSIEEYETLKKETNKTIAQALLKQEAALEQQEQMSDQQRLMSLEKYKALKERTEEEIAQISGRVGDDQIAFLRTLLKQEEATLDSKNRLIVIGNKQNKNKNHLLISGGVAVACSFVPSLLKDNVASFLMANSQSQNSKKMQSFRRLGCISAVLAIIGIGTFIYAEVYLPHTDTESLEADAQLAQGTIEDLKARLVALQTKTPCPQEDESSPEAAATPTPKEVPGVITEEPQVPADKEEAQDFEPVED